MKFMTSKSEISMDVKLENKLSQKSYWTKFSIAFCLIWSLISWQLSTDVDFMSNMSFWLWNFINVVITMNEISSKSAQI